MLVALLLAACTPALPDALVDCADQDCRERWIEAHYAADPPGVVDAVAHLPDPLVQAALLGTVAQKHPDVLELCRRFPAGPARERCQTLKVRPHLWQATSGAQAEARPSFRTLDAKDAAHVGWEGTTAEYVPCTTALETCQTDAAVTRAATGDLPGVAAACVALDAGRWRDECFFQAAESAAGSGLLQGVPSGATLCLSAPLYLPQCLLHLTWPLAQIAPPASSGGTIAWGGLTAAITGAAERIAQGDPVVAKTWASRAWSNALRAAYEGEPTVTGVPYTYLPAEAAPAITCAAAWRLWDTDADAARPLAAWGELLATRLADRTPLPDHPRQAPRKSVIVADLWTDVLPGEEALQRVGWLGGSTRAVASDDRGERLVCLLELAARETPPRSDLLAEGLRDPDRVVRWTAARLLGAVPGAESQTARVREDPDALVRGRAAP